MVSFIDFLRDIQQKLQIQGENLEMSKSEVLDVWSLGVWEVIEVDIRVKFIQGKM